MEGMNQRKEIHKSNNGIKLWRKKEQNKKKKKYEGKKLRQKAISNHNEPLIKQQVHSNQSRSAMKLRGYFFFHFNNYSSD